VKAILLPIKDPANAKQRLAAFLSIEERIQLVWAMLEDVSRAVAASELVDRVVAVAHDPVVIRYALSKGWEVVPEGQQISESHSVDEASSCLGQQGVTAVLRLPGDIPLLQVGDVDLLLSAAITFNHAILVPSRDGLGTNALLRTPPIAFPSRFGRNSFQLHLEEARLAGVPLRVIESPRVALDLDEFSDLVYFWEHGRGTLTRELMAKLDLIGRFLEQSQRTNAIT
jgi:2-phospho-L-lactate/phosphoenolpyruvate guanylyltransferase